MRKRGNAAVIATLLCFVIFIGIVYSMEFSEYSQAETIFVDISGESGEFTSIQEAIDSASEGDTVFVFEGTYNENIIINKTLSLAGESSVRTIIDGGKRGDVVTIDSNFVNLSGFNIRNSGDSACGVRVNSVYNSNISGNQIKNNNWGIHLERDGSVLRVDVYVGMKPNETGEVKPQYNHNISNNLITDNWIGINCNYFSKMLISDNKISSSGRYGIGLSISDGSVICNNEISLSGDTGITIDGSEYCLISDNLIVNNGEEGLFLGGTQNSMIHNNTFSYNSDPEESYHGNIVIHNSQNNTFSNNILYGHGLFLMGEGIESYCNNIDISNILNDKPIYYFKNETNISLNDLQIAQLILVNCSYFLISNLSLNHINLGLLMVHSSNNTISYSNISNNLYGIALHCSSDNVFQYNEIVANYHRKGRSSTWYYANPGCGLTMYLSHNNLILRNMITGSSVNGIYLRLSSGNSIKENNIDGNEHDGIYIMESNENNISMNTIRNNGRYGIHIRSASSYLWFPETSSENIITRNNIISNGFNGLTLEWTKENIITFNTFIGRGSTVSYRGSQDDIFHHNNFIGKSNFFAVILNDSQGAGNFWSEYKGKDDGSNERIANDGIGDTDLPHKGDDLPLMEPVDGFSPLIPPLQIRNLEIRNGNNRVDLTWDAPIYSGGSNISHYIIYRGVHPSNMSIYVVVENDPGYVDDEVRNEKLYYYRVTAVNRIGESLQSEAVIAAPSSIYDTYDTEAAFSCIASIIILIVIISIFLILGIKDRRGNKKEPKND